MFTGKSPDRVRTRSFANAFSPSTLTKVEDVIVEGDRAGERFHSRGTHQGELFGIPATGITMEATGSNILRIVDGKVVEHWATAMTLE